MVNTLLNINSRALRWCFTTLAVYLLLAPAAQAADCAAPATCAVSSSVVMPTTVSDLQLQLTKITENMDALSARLDAVYRTLGSTEAALVADLKRTSADQQAQIAQVTRAAASAQSSANSAQFAANSALSAAASAQESANDALSRVDGVRFHFRPDHARIEIHADDYPNTVPLLWLDSSTISWWHL